MKWHNAFEEWPKIDRHVLAVDNERDFILGYARPEYIHDWKLGDMTRNDVKFWIYLDDIILPETP